MSDNASRASGVQATLSLRNEISELSRVTEFLAAFFGRHGQPTDLRADCELAIEEIFVNVVRYGYPMGGEHQIELMVRLESGVITLVVEDDGMAFNPLEAKLPDLDLPIEKRAAGGLGIYLVKGVMDELQYERVGERNRMVMRKRVGQ